VRSDGQRAETGKSLKELGLRQIADQRDVKKGRGPQVFLTAVRARKRAVWGEAGDATFAAAERAARRPRER
jgi:hypothetical protein